MPYCRNVEQRLFLQAVCFHIWQWLTCRIFFLVEIHLFVRAYLLYFNLLVSTHVVCERLFVMQGLPKFGLANILLKIPWVLPLKYFRNVGLDRHPLPPPYENFGRSWHFGFELVWRTPPLENEYVGGGVWRLIAVSLKDTVSFFKLERLYPHFKCLRI